MTGGAETANKAGLSIAFVTGSASRRAGGLFTSVRRLAQALAETGHRLSVLALDDPFGAEDEAAWHPLRPERFKPVGPPALGYAPDLGRALLEGGFDIVHQHGIWQATSLAVRAWAKRTGRPVMISPRGMLDRWALRNARWKKRLAGALYEHANLRHADMLHALGAAEAEAIRAFGLRAPIAVIPNGIDLPADAAPGPRPAFLPQDGRRTLLFLGRLHPKKGIAELIEAFALLNRDAPALAATWRLAIAGWDDGGDEPALRGAVERHGLGGKVVLPGPLFGAAKDAALRHADAFVLPSFSEGLPMSVLEAWAYQLPVLMTDACNLPEGFAEGAAFRIETRPDLLAAGLARALASHDLAAAGRRGRFLVEERFSWRRIARQHDAVYRKMAAGLPLKLPADVRPEGLPA